RVEGFGGGATVVRGARLDPAGSARVEAQLREARAAEYRGVAAEAGRLLEHVRREREHRDFRFEELEELEADLGQVRRWAGQIRARDHFGVAAAADADALLGRCEEALAAFLEEAARVDETDALAGAGAAAAGARPPGGHSGRDEAGP